MDTANEMKLYLDGSEVTLIGLKEALDKLGTECDENHYEVIELAEIAGNTFYFEKYCSSIYC